MGLAFIFVLLLEMSYLLCSRLNALPSSLSGFERNDIHGRQGASES